MFKYYNELESINLAENKISVLPKEAFSANLGLKKLNLSSNLLQQITFDVTQLTNLTDLDLSYNSMDYLNAASRKSLDELYNNQLQAWTSSDLNKTAIVNLHGNPFSCKCKSHDFIKWFITSPIFSATRSAYTCSIDGQTIPLDTEDVAAATDDCERSARRLRKILLSTFMSTFGAGTMIVVFWVMFRKYKRHRQIQEFEEKVGLVKANETGFQFLVFLSYSSCDGINK